MMQWDDFFIENAHRFYRLNLSNDSLYVSFPQYVAFVQLFIEHFLEHQADKKRKQCRPVIFTGLCITPLQWFNYNITPEGNKKLFHIKSLDHIKTFWADQDWVDYHTFLIRLRCTRGAYCQEPIQKCVKTLLFSGTKKKCPDFQEQDIVKFYRYLLTVEDSVPLTERVVFPRQCVVTEQLNKLWIKFPDNESRLVFGYGDSALDERQYQEIPTDALAYYVGEGDSEDRPNLGEVFALCFQKEKYCNITVSDSNVSLTQSISLDAYKNISLNGLPEDFIIFGNETNNKPLDPLFALGCDVSEDKVKLSFIRDSPTLSNLVDFVKDYLIQ